MQTYFRQTLKKDILKGYSQNMTYLNSSVTNGGVTMTTTSSKVKISGTCTTRAAFHLSSKLTLEPNTSYTIKYTWLNSEAANTNTQSIYIWDYVGGASYGQLTISSSKTSVTFTSPADTSNMMLDMWTVVGTTYDMAFQVSISDNSGSIIKSGSLVNGTSYSSDTTVTSDLTISRVSTLASGSKIKRGSTINHVNYTTDTTTSAAITVLALTNAYPASNVNICIDDKSTALTKDNYKAGSTSLKGTNYVKSKCQIQAFFNAHYRNSDGTAPNFCLQGSVAEGGTPNLTLTNETTEGGSVTYYVYFMDKVLYYSSTSPVTSTSTKTAIKTFTYQWTPKINKIWVAINGGGGGGSGGYGNFIGNDYGAGGGGGAGFGYCACQLNNWNSTAISTLPSFLKVVIGSAGYGRWGNATGSSGTASYISFCNKSGTELLRLTANGGSVGGQAYSGSAGGGGSGGTASFSVSTYAKIFGDGYSFTRTGGAGGSGGSWGGNGGSSASFTTTTADITNLWSTASGTIGAGVGGDGNYSGSAGGGGGGACGRPNGNGGWGSSDAGGAQEGFNGGGGGGGGASGTSGGTGGRGGYAQFNLWC